MIGNDTKCAGSRNIVRSGDIDTKYQAICPVCHMSIHVTRARDYWLLQNHIDTRLCANEWISSDEVGEDI